MWVMISLCWKTEHEMLCVCYSWHVPTAIWGWAQITKINVQIHWQIHKHTQKSENYRTQSSGGVYPMINYMIICNTHQYRLQMVFVTVFALFTFLFAFCGVSLKNVAPAHNLMPEWTWTRVSVDQIRRSNRTGRHSDVTCLLISDHHYTSPQTLQTSHQTRPLLQIVCIIFRFIHSALGVYSKQRLVYV